MKTVNNKIGIVLKALVPFTCLVASSQATAKPGAPAAWCDSQVYGQDAADCQGRTPTCALCHTSTGYDLGWNAYGNAIYGELYSVDPLYDGSDSAFNSIVGQAALNIESNPGDHDADGLSTYEEILLGTGPGDPSEYFWSPDAPVGDPNPSYLVGEYDPMVAYTRTMVAFCGRSPSYAEKQALIDTDDSQDLIRTTLDDCMKSTYWTNVALPQLADDKIRPIPRFEFWDWDYRLWRFANLPPCGDVGEPCNETRSARDLLVGQYHVREPEMGKLIKDPNNGFEPPSFAPCGEDAGVCDYDEECIAGQCKLAFGYQDDDETKRAGMITTSWYHFSFTMFSSMPRTSAAQAMRAYLGADIAKQEGLIYQQGEPLDIDNKGVDGVGCLECHMRLDSATYAFAYYNGIGDGPLGKYNPNRPLIKGLWDPSVPNEVPQARFNGAPVPDLMTWADRAADSDEFKRNHAMTFFKHAVGREPRPNELDEFRALWQSMDADGYETPKLLHRLVQMRAFGGV